MQRFKRKLLGNSFLWHSFFSLYKMFSLFLLVFLGSLYNQSVIMQFISQWKTGSLTKRSPSSFNPRDLRALAIGQQDQPIRKSNASFLSNWWSGYSYSLQSVATPFKDWPTRLASSNIRFMVKEGKHQGELNENFAKPKRGSQVGHIKSIVRS